MSINSCILDAMHVGFLFIVDLLSCLLKEFMYKRFIRRPSETYSDHPPVYDWFTVSFLLHARLFTAGLPKKNPKTLQKLIFLQEEASL